MDITTAERRPAMKDTQKSAESSAATGKTFEGLTDEERAARSSAPRS
jgi:hypothetical protein